MKKFLLMLFIGLGCTMAAYAEITAQQLQDVYNSPDFLSFLSKTKCPHLEGNTPENVEKYYDFKLDRAVWEGDISQVKHWLALGARSDRVLAVHLKCSTVLHNAVYLIIVTTKDSDDAEYKGIYCEEFYHRMAILRLLLESKPDLDIKEDISDLTLLHYASDAICLPLVQALLDAGANPTVRGQMSCLPSEWGRIHVVQYFNPDPVGKITPINTGYAIRDLLLKAEQEWNEKHKTV